MKSYLLSKTLGLALAAAALVSAAPINFIHGGNNYGVMDITRQTDNQIRVQFTANAVPGLTDFQVTGFAFSFANAYEYGSHTVTNPSNAAFTDDQNSLNWRVLNNLNPIPNPANSSTVTKDSYEFGVTEGNANNYNPPGIHPGQTDYFYIAGFRNITPATNLDNVVTLAGIRLQAINPGGGSLFLNGTYYVPPVTPPTPAVPEPSTVALLGFGLVGLAWANRRRKKA